VSNKFNYGFTIFILYNFSFNNALIKQYSSLMVILMCAIKVTQYIVNMLHTKKMICVFNPLHKSSFFNIRFFFNLQHAESIQRAKPRAEGFSQRYNMIELRQMAITHPIGDCSPTNPCILLVCMLFGNQILDLASASAKLLMFNQDTCWVLVLVNVFVRRPATHIQCSICLIVRYFVNTFKFLGINIFIIMS